MQQENESGLQLHSQTDIGLVRASNQDAQNGGELPGNAVWSVVCDGMGGVNGGNIASELAVRQITRQVQASYKAGSDGEYIKNLIVAAVYGANAAVYDMACKNSGLYGMGTTVVLAIVVGEQAHIAHAGDSRAYLFQNGSLRQLTVDHSMVQEMVNNGDLGAEEARVHPQRNIITRALGVEAEVEIDYRVCDFPPGSQLLLCTDGLTNHVEDAQILSCAALPPEELCARLITLAKEGGGSDNITVSVIRNAMGG